MLITSPASEVDNENMSLALITPQTIRNCFLLLFTDDAFWTGNHAADVARINGTICPTLSHQTRPLKRTLVHRLCSQITSSALWAVLAPAWGGRQLLLVRLPQHPSFL